MTPRDFECVYLVEEVPTAKHPAGQVKVGYASQWANRKNGYRNSTVEPLLFIRGTHDDEVALLSFWTGNPRGGWFDPTDEFWEWVAALSEMEHTTPDPDQVAKLPQIPLSAWHPSSIGTRVEPDGQMTIVDGWSPRARAKFKAALGEKTSLSDEWFTPAPYIRSAREVMGSIDTDPASHYEANRTVQARYWYDRQTDGLDLRHPWQGNVWLNPPYGRGDSSAKHFVMRLMRELEAGTVKQAITVLNNSSTDARWFRSIWETAAVHCMHVGRIDFQVPGGGGSSSPNKGSIFSYWGSRDTEFAAEFAQYGPPLLVPRDWRGQ